MENLFGRKHRRQLVFQFGDLFLIQFVSIAKLVQIAFGKVFEDILRIPNEKQSVRIVSPKGSVNEFHQRDRRAIDPTETFGEIFR